MLANEYAALKYGICDLRVLVRKLVTSFDRRKKVSTQVQLTATCETIWPGLKNQGPHSNFAPSTKK